MVLALLEPFDEYEAKMLKKAIYVKIIFQNFPKFKTERLKLFFF